MDGSNFSHWGIQYGIRHSAPVFQESRQSYLEHTKERLGYFRTWKIQGDLWAHPGETTWQFPRIFLWTLLHIWAGSFPSIGNRVPFHRTRISAEREPRLELFPPWLLIVDVALDALRKWLQMRSCTGSLCGSFCKVLCRPEFAVILKHFDPYNKPCLPLGAEGTSWNLQTVTMFHLAS